MLFYLFLLRILFLLLRPFALIPRDGQFFPPLIVIFLLLLLVAQKSIDRLKAKFPQIFFGRISLI
jgi:hypothetical protein